MHRKQEESADLSSPGGTASTSAGGPPCTGSPVRAAATPVSQLTPLSVHLFPSSGSQQTVNKEVNTGGHIGDTPEGRAPPQTGHQPKGSFGSAEQLNRSPGSWAQGLWCRQREACGPGGTRVQQQLRLWPPPHVPGQWGHECSLVCGTGPLASVPLNSRPLPTL